ncbi:MAG: c-type cytochrome, partial [Bacteroidia bacterium]
MRIRKVFTTCRLFFYLTLFATVSFVNAGHAYGSIEEGKQLFQANCAKCHMIDRKMTGPALQGVTERWPDSTKLYAWIKNSQAFLATGDEYANKLYLEYSKSPMQAFPNLADNEIASILAYINAEAARIEESKKAAETPVGVATSAPKDNTVLYLILVAVLLII